MISTTHIHSGQCLLRSRKLLGRLALSVLVIFALSGIGDMQTPDYSACTPNRCEISLWHVVTVSDREVSGAFGNAANLVARDEQNRLYFAVQHGFVVFNEEGELIARIGDRGLIRFRVPSAPLIGPDGSVHVFDAVRRKVTVFDASLTPLRTLEVPVRRAHLILDDGSYLVAEQIRTSCVK